MRLADYLQERDAPAAAGDAGAVRSEVKARLREVLYREVSSERIAQLVGYGRARARTELAASIEQALYLNDFPALSPDEREALVAETLDMVLGLGPVEGLLADETVTEIMVNGPSSVFYEREGVLYPADEQFASEEQLRLVVDRIVSPLGRRVDEQCPIVNARLPEGHRVNVVIPPVSMEGTALTIRKFRAVSFSLAELVEMGTLTAEMATLLRWAVRARRNIAVSGGTGGGKTTLLNALSRQIPGDERIVTIEDSAELRFDQHPHVVRLEARMPNAEGRGEVTIRDLVTNALRMRPDRIIVGECRGPEALDMLQAMNTGHDGSMTTLHANSPAEVVSRLVMMVRYGMDLPAQLVEAQVASALDVIVQQDRLSGGRRRITQIAVRHRLPVGGDGASAPVPDGDGRQLFVPVVLWDRERGEYAWLGVPSWTATLPAAGVATREEVAAWTDSVRSCCCQPAR